MLRSPTGSGIVQRQSGSLTNLSSHGLYQDELGKTDEPFITTRKRKQPELDTDIKQELETMHKKMDKMMNFLTEFTNTQNENMKKLSEDVILIKDQMSHIQTITENLIREQKSIKTKLSGLTNLSQNQDKKIEFLESTVQQLKESSSLVTKKQQICDHEDIMSEIKERRVRENNIILKGIPEPHLKDRRERQDSDKHGVIDIINMISKDLPEPIWIRRLGKYDTNKCRPIKIVFSNSGPVKSILRLKRNVELNDIKIFSDLTTTQQTYYKNIKSQLNFRINNGEENLTIKYKNGVPKIVQENSKKSNPLSPDGRAKL